LNSALIRADGSNKIGLGHLTRQIDIANELKRKNYEVVFLTKNYSEGISILKENNLKIIKLKNFKQNLTDSMNEINNLLNVYKQKFDLIVVDLFKDFDNQEYLNNLKKYCKKLFVLSDEPDPFYVDVDAVFAISETQVSNDYSNLKTKYYAGLKYFPLNSKFQGVPKKIIKKNVENILITFGGSDPNNYSAEIMKTLKEIRLNAKITLVIGAGFSKEYYNDLIENKPNDVEVKVNIKNMIEYLISTDLCICSAGNTLIEALTCGAPCIVIPQTKLENQRAMLLERKNMVINMNLNFNKEEFVIQLKNLIKNNSMRTFLSITAQNYLDGSGLKRIVEILSKKE
jgi:UDP-2,4-diacetamido-2,4,6-trideoxy-beta-L-altropyranose hydrolase